MICKVVPQNLTIDIQINETIFEALQKADVRLFSPCGGKGVCGKCTICLKEGHLPISPEDRKFFTEEQLRNGYRLGCKAVPNEDITIEIYAGDDDLAQASSYLYGIESMEAKPEAKDIIAVDIGTTTIAFAWVDGGDKSVKNTYTTTNHQRSFGADVIARIVAAGEGKAEDLKASVKKDITEGIKKLLEGKALNNPQLIITGNTTMEHLLLGYDVSGLGVYPFTPVSVETVYTDWKTLFENEDYDMPVTVMPGFTTYVGADILAGLLACDMYGNDKNSLLIDLGTNGEMALATKDTLHITSTAAGPAFEGGNISCGMPGVEGAVSKVSFTEGGFKAETINNVSPKGICGSGIIDAIACMVEQELVDETGLLDDDYFDDGVLIAKGDAEIVITQKDVREMQLAKSAVRAGLETLIKKAGLKYADIDRVYLAGGFGQYIDIGSAVSIGLMPEELKSKIIVAGNTALAGAVCFGLQQDAQDIAAQMKKAAVETDLSTDKDFQNGYMEYIYFGE